MGGKFDNQQKVCWSSGKLEDTEAEIEVTGVGDGEADERRDEEDGDAGEL